MTEAKRMQLTIDGRKTEVTIDVKPTGFESAMFCAPFDVALAGVNKYSQEVISLAQNAQIRIQEGKDANVSKVGNFTREGVLYFPQDKPKLVRYSPILHSFKEATELSRRNGAFYPSQSQIESALTDSTDFPKSKTEIPTNRFDSDALAVWAFGGENQARLYGEFLKNAGLDAMLVRETKSSYVLSQRNSFARQVWFSSIEGKSCIDGTLSSLYSPNWVRGVREIK